jgi:hypothetical protein
MRWQEPPSQTGYRSGEAPHRPAMWETRLSCMGGGGREEVRTSEAAQKGAKRGGRGVRETVRDSSRRPLERGAIPAEGGPCTHPVRTVEPSRVAHSWQCEC